MPSMTDAEIFAESSTSRFFTICDAAMAAGSDLGHNLSGIDRQVIGAICEQLKDGGLIHWKPLKGAQEGFVIGMAKITAIGVDVVDGVRKPPIAIQFAVSFSSPASPAQTDVVDNKTSERTAVLGLRSGRRAPEATSL